MTSNKFYTSYYLLEYQKTKDNSIRSIVFTNEDVAKYEFSNAKTDSLFAKLTELTEENYKLIILDTIEEYKNFK